jgi:hypothetical protein
MNYQVINGEERWTALGHTDNFRVLLLVWTVRRVLTDRHCARCWNESAGRLFARQGIIDMKKLIVPKFPTAAAEAEWWDGHMDIVLREARELKSVTIQMHRADVNRAERLSAKQGLRSETYLQTLLHEALQREEPGESTRDES